MSIQDIHDEEAIRVLGEIREKLSSLRPGDDFARELISRMMGDAYWLSQRLERLLRQRGVVEDNPA